MVRHRGRVIVLGDKLTGATDAREFWSVAGVIVHLEHLFEEYIEDFMTTHATYATLHNLRDLSNGLTRTGRQLVTTTVGLTVVHKELNGVLVTAPESINPPSQLDAGRGELHADVDTISPLDHIRLNIALNPNNQIVIG